MGIELRFYFALIFLAAILSIHNSVLVWRRRHSSLGTASFLLVLAVTVWLVPNVMELMVDDLTFSILSFKIGFLGAFSLPVTWVIYAAYLIGKETWITYRRVILLMIIPVFLFVLVLANQFWTSITPIQVDGISLLQVNYSAWLTFWQIFSYTLDGFGILLIIWSVIRSPRRYLWRGVIILVAVLLPILANAESSFSLIPRLQIDLTPFALLFTVLIMIWGGFRYQLFDVVPVARETLVDRVADGMVVLDVGGRVLDLNLAARSILGKTLYQARFKPLAMLLPEVGPALTQMAGKTSERSEVVLERRGRKLHYDVFLTPIKTRLGELGGTLLVLHDISELKRGESQLRAALEKEKDLAQTRARFVAVASHAFRTPLTTIKSSADLLETYYDRWTEEKRSDHLGRIRQSVSVMLHLLKRLLAYEELQSGKTRITAVEVDLVEMCRRVIRELPESHQAAGAVQFTSHGTSFKAWQDEGLLYQVLSNLLSNAVKYSPAGTPVNVDLYVNDQVVRLEVIDRGIGIPAGDLPHLGEAFFRGSNTANISGSGLGLLIVRSSLSLVGGELHIESSQQSGTVMRAVFPLNLPGYNAN